MTRYLPNQDTERLSEERERAEAQLASVKQREEALALKQRETIGQVLLDLVSTKAWTRDELHDFLRPHIRRKRDARLLGIDLEQASGLLPDSDGSRPISNASSPVLSEDGQPSASELEDDA